ncbi:hypothetical protein [Fibrella aquatica]|uniref:hypothetical protein n=1 Tax=Fibrella aquatica TaxID=3242487 RepID=UPI0035212841
MENGNEQKQTAFTMNNQKRCPQCNSYFEGRSNQLYCSALCKQRAFRAGKAERVNSSAIPSTPVQSHSISSTAYVSPVDVQTAKVLETLRLQNIEQMKRLEIEEREQEREFESERAEREFAKERERAQWEREALKIQLSHKSAENSESALVGVESKPNTEENEEPSGGFGLGEMLLLGIGGLFVASFLKNQPNQIGTDNRPKLDVAKKPPFPIFGLKDDKKASS